MTVAAEAEEQPPEGRHVGALPVMPSLAQARALAAEHNLIPLQRQLHRRLRDARVGVPEAARAEPVRPGVPARVREQGQRVGRWSFIGFEPNEVLRWSLADGGDPYALAASGSPRFRQAPMVDPPPFTGGAVGVFGYDLVRAVEPLGRAQPGSTRGA